MSDVTRVEFGATLEEIVDVDMRLVMSTKTYRRGRRQSQSIVGVIIAGVVAVALQDHLPLTAITALTALSGFLSGSLYGVFYETWVKQSYMPMVHAPQDSV